MNFYDILAWLLPTRSVDSIVNILTKIAVRLAAAEEQQNNRIADIDATIASLKDERSVATAEAAKAARIRQNIEAITA